VFRFVNCCCIKIIYVISLSSNTFVTSLAGRHQICNVYNDVYVNDVTIHIPNAAQTVLIINDPNTELY